MVKRCAFGICNSDDRYPERVEGVVFIPFPKPKTNLERCLRWIKLCNRPHFQLNVDKINKNSFVCSKHFHDDKGPTPLYPDPLPASPCVNECDRTPLTPIRQPPKRRKLSLETPPRSASTNEDLVKASQNDSEIQDHPTSTVIQNKDTTAACQTEGKWIDPLEMITVASENEQLKRDVAALNLKLEEMKRKSKGNQCTLSINELERNAGLFKYYTGFTSEQFNVIYSFLVPSEDVPISFPSHRQKEIMNIDTKHQLLLTIMKLRHDFDYSDLGCRFGLSKQTVSIIFSHWVNYMYMRFGEVSIWPPRDIIYEHMPKQYREEFPTTFAILDCTEIKICKPSSLKVQSQTYSDYKSTNTLKSLVVCDPRGSVIFTSMLFAGSMSDKEIFVKSGCQEMLKQLVQEEYLKEGDGLMADKGFNIQTEVSECGLKLNIPPFARQGAQMSQDDALLTKKIAKHRVHVERAIARIKRFEIVSGRVPLSLYGIINQIWYVCAFLTNFFMPCIQEKDSADSLTL